MKQAIFAIILVAPFAVAATLGSQSSPPASATTPPAQASSQAGEICPCGADCQCAAECQAQLADALQRIADLESQGYQESEPTPAHVHSAMLFSASWCQPCQVSHQHADELKAAGWDVTEVDIDASPELADQHGISQVPTWIIFEDGTEEARWTGNSRADWLQQTRAAVANDLVSLNGVASNGMQYVSYSEPTYSTRTYTRTVYRREREVCEACGRPIRRRGRW